MGENNDEPRPGFDYFVTHKGQGKYFDTEFNFNGERREVRKGYYTTVVTDIALDWLQRDHAGKPWMMILGHKAPHSFYTPEPKYAHAFDDVKVSYPETAFSLDDKPEWIKERLPTWHGIYGPLFEWRKKFPDERPEAVKDFENMVHALLGHDPQRRRQRRPAARLARRHRSAREHDHRLRGRQRTARRRARHGRQTNDARAEHPHSDGREVPGLTKDPRVIEQQVLTDGHGSQPAGTRGRTGNARHRRPIVGQARARRQDPAWRKSWFYYYNYEKEFPYTPNVRGIRTDEWKYMHYPHGDGSPDRHLAELYDLKKDPGELVNLVKLPEQASTLQRLQSELTELMAATGLTPATDKMPLDEGIKKELPAQNIR